MRRAWARILAGSLVAVLSMSGLWMGGAMMGREPMVLEYHGPMPLNAWYPLVSFGSWIVATPATVLTALVVPCVMIGVGVARWGVLQIPAGIASSLPALPSVA